MIGSALYSYLLRIAFSAYIYERLAMQMLMPIETQHRFTLNCARNNWQPRMNTCLSSLGRDRSDYCGWMWRRATAAVFHPVQKESWLLIRKRCVRLQYSYCLARLLLQFATHLPAECKFVFLIQCIRIVDSIVFNLIICITASNDNT